MSVARDVGPNCSWGRTRLRSTIEQPGHASSVLLVDDDSDLRQLYGMKLRSDGFEVHLAADGSQALAAAHGGLGLILLDFRMPGMGGLEVLRRLKDDEDAARAPVVMLSNECDAGAVAACRALGAAAWWRKCGLVPGELSRRVRELIDSR